MIVFVFSVSSVDSIFIQAKFTKRISVIQNLEPDNTKLRLKSGKFRFS